MGGLHLIVHPVDGPSNLPPPSLLLFNSPGVRKTVVRLEALAWLKEQAYSPAVIGDFQTKGGAELAAALRPSPRHSHSIS